MLKLSTLNSASTLASQLADKGLTAVAKTNTVLNELVALSSLPFEIPLDSEEAIQEAFLTLEQTTRGTLEVPNQHGLQLDGIVKDLSKLVTSHISYAKNTVKPLVVDLAKEIETYLTTYKPKSASELFEVKVLDLPEIVTDESFLGTLTPYKEKVILKPDLRFKLAAKTHEELLGLVTYGYERTDKLVLDWVSKQAPEFLERVFNSFFTIEQVKDVLSYEDIERLNVFEKLDHALAILLMSNKLFDTVDESAQNVDLQVYKNTAAQYRDYAGALVVVCLNQIASFNKTERLVMEMQPGKYLAKVNGMIYRPWLQAGGSPEVIMGLIIVGDTGSSKSFVDSKRDGLLERWNSFCTFYNADQSNKTLDYFKQFLLSQFSIQLKDVSELEQNYIEKNPNYYATVNKVAEEYVNCLKTDDMKDVFGIALFLVAQARFFYTSAYNILNDINEAAKVNPNVDVREAALLAVINYIADYLANQIAIVAGQ